jgi:hypothetical protein
MAFDITTGMVQAGTLYQVTGTVTYNGISWTNQNFRGIAGVSVFTGTGSVTEVTELKGAAVVFLQNPDENYGNFADGPTKISGAAVVFVQNANEAKVNETTKILGMAVNFLDYPFYQVDIMEQRG